MIRLKPQVIFDFNTGETFKINDNTGIYDPILNITGYGLPNLVATNVTATRFIFNSYLKEQQRNKDSSVIIAGVEYKVVGSGSFVYDTKTYNAGDIFISMADGTPTIPSTLKLEETGRFQPVSYFLPVEVETGDFTPSLLGINSIRFPDSVYNVQVDVYTTNYSAQIGIPAGIYYVNGTPGQTVTVSGVTYRVGEVMNQGGIFTMTGTGNISLFSNTTTDPNGVPDYVYFLCGYYAFQSILDMSSRLANSYCKCIDKLKTNYTLAMNLWLAIQTQFSNPDGDIDISGIQTALQEIVSLNNQCRC